MRTRLTQSRRADVGEGGDGTRTDAWINRVLRCVFLCGEHSSWLKPGHDATENQARSDRGADASIPVGSHLFSPPMGLTLPALEQLGHRFVSGPQGPTVNAVSWLNRDRGWRVRACFCVGDAVQMKILMLISAWTRVGWGHACVRVDLPLCVRGFASSI